MVVHLVQGAYQGEFLLGRLSIICLHAGEVHLETIIKDLRERFARIELSVSPPLIAFRESVLMEGEAPEPAQKPPVKVNASITLSSIPRKTFQCLLHCLVVILLGFFLWHWGMHIITNVTHGAIFKGYGMFFKKQPARQLLMACRCIQSV